MTQRDKALEKIKLTNPGHDPEPEGVPLPPGPTPEADPLARKAFRDRRLNNFVALCGVVTVLFAFLSLATWSDPLWPVILYFGLLVTPMACFLLWQAREDFSEFRKFFTYALIVGSPFLAWNMAWFRVAVFDAAAPLLPESAVVLAARDRDADVAGLACLHGFERGSSALRARLTRAMEFRPEVASRCLGALERIGEEQVVALSRHMTIRWYRQMLSARDDAGRELACEAARAMPTVVPLGRADAAPYLLDCALGAVDPDVGMCCGQSLGQGYPASANPDVQPAGVDRSMALTLFHNLARHLDVPAQELLRQRSENAAIPWPPALQLHWASRLGCFLVDEMERPERIAHEFTRVTHQQCGLEVQDALYTYEATRLVRRTCAPLQTQDIGTPIDLIEWCASAREAAWVTAVESASFAVHAARETFFVESDARAITSGALIVKARRDALGLIQPSELAEAQRRATFDSNTEGTAHHDWLVLSAKEEAQMAEALRKDRSHAATLREEIRYLEERRQKLGSDDPKAARLDAMIRKARNEQTHAERAMPAP